MGYSQSVTIEVPATSANLGPGFDSLGLALDWTARYQVTISDEMLPAPDGPIEHMTATAVRALYRQEGAQEPLGLSITYEGDIPIGRGLGVSGSARAAGLIAANELLGKRQELEDLVSLAVHLEGHGDNIIPAMFGGLRVVVDDDDGVIHLGIDPPTDLEIALLIPQFSMPTDESRKRLPERLTRSQAVHNIGRAALLMGALTQNNYQFLAKATEDILHQPARSTLFPAMYALFQAARDAGGLAAYLSGGGSTIAAFAIKGEGKKVASAMRETGTEHGLEVETRVCRMSSIGAKLIGLT